MCKWSFEGDLKAIHCFQTIPSAFRSICGEDCKLNHHTRKRMSQSARAGGRGQRKGRNAASRVSPPIPPSTYFRVLALPSCGISSCKAVSVNQRRDMEREDHVGLGKVAAASKKKEDDPLPF